MFQIGLKKLLQDLITKVKDTVLWRYVISDLKKEELQDGFLKKNLLKISQTEFKVEKVIKRKDNKLYVKWKSYDNSFNSWVDEKDTE